MQCQLLGGVFAILLQIFLGSTALCTLIYKRMLENPRRKVLVWLFDTSKQVFGAGLGHVMNMALSIFFNKLQISFNGSDECELYIANSSMDYFIGTFIIWGLVKCQLTLARKADILCLSHTGYYGDPPSFLVYLVQLVAFLLILVAAKIVLVWLLYVLYDPIVNATVFLFKPISAYPDFELLIVMIICPWILNSIQFWILDNIVMHKVRDADAYKIIESIA